MVFHSVRDDLWPKYTLFRPGRPVSPVSAGESSCATWVKYPHDWLVVTGTMGFWMTFQKQLGMECDDIPNWNHHNHQPVMSSPHDTPLLMDDGEKSSALGDGSSYRVLIIGL